MEYKQIELKDQKHDVSAIELFLPVLETGPSFFLDTELAVITATKNVLYNLFPVYFHYKYFYIQQVFIKPGEYIWI